MDMSSAWLLETDMEDTGFMNYDQMGKLSDKIDNLGVDLFYSEDLTFMDQSSQSQNGGIELPKVQEMCNNINISPPTLEPLLATSLPSSNTFTISFGDLNPKEEIFLELHGSLGYKAADSTKIPTIVRNPIQAQDHVLAERKRREKLNQHLISLSGLLPNRKKMGKASVLEDACNYIKELQGRVKELEELSGSKRKNVQESITSIKRLSLTEAKSDGSTEPWIVSPEIEVRMSGKSVLVRIQCQEKTSSLVKALTQMEKLGLSIISSNAMPFAKTTLLINIVAQIRDEFRITSTELVKHLQLTLVKPDKL